jgi:hypothetical protein
VHDDIDVGHQFVDRAPVKDVPLAVLGLVPAQFVKAGRKVDPWRRLKSGPPWGTGRSDLGG